MSNHILNNSSLELLERIIPIFPQRDPFCNSTLMNNIHFQEHQKYIDLWDNTDYILTDYLVNFGFVIRMPIPELEISHVIGWDFKQPHVSPEILLTDKGRKLQEFKSIDIFYEHEEKEKKLEIKRQKWRDRKARWDAGGGILITIIASLIAACTFLGVKWNNTNNESKVLQNKMTAKDSIQNIRFNLLKQNLEQNGFAIDSNYKITKNINNNFSQNNNHGVISNHQKDGQTAYQINNK